MPTQRSADIVTLPIHRFDDGPAPMRFPDPEELERARKRRQARLDRDRLVIETQRLIHARDLAEQRKLAREEGFRKGHVSGTHWGITVGGTVGAALAVVAMQVAPIIAPRILAWWPL